MDQVPPVSAERATDRDAAARNPRVNDRIFIGTPTPGKGKVRRNRFC
jgi:hypothetical protein